MAVVPTVLNHDNYNNWSSRMKTYLLAEDLWDIVQVPEPDEFPDEAERKAWEKKNAKALYAIESSCGDDIYELIKDITRAKVAWGILRANLNPDAHRIDDKDERSLVQAFPTRIDGNDRVAAMEGGLNAGHDEISNANDINATFVRIDGNDGDAAMEEGRSAGHDEINATFVRYVKCGDWDNVIKLLRDHRRLGGFQFYRNEESEGTALHVAFRMYGMTVNERMCGMTVNERIVEQLVELMEEEDLEKQDYCGRTALYYLVHDHPERVELAKRMLEKNDKILTIFPHFNHETPLVVHAEGMENAKGMARYLYSVTPHETLRVTDGAQLISLGFQFNRFDIAWNLIQRYPQLIMDKDYNGDFPLKTLANNRHAFLSGSRLNFWEKLIYCGIRIRIRPLTRINENCVNVQKPESGQSDQRHLSNKNENQKPL